jgi:adenosylmethionine-8-amino-7-oxononanoate aminotransferase
MLIRPLGSTVYLMPPYCTPPARLHHAYTLLKSILESMHI